MFWVDGQAGSLEARGERERENINIYLTVTSVLLRRFLVKLGA